MEDEYQSTLKGKIKILYQLEKWQDVSKLCVQYNEKYGKDVDIDLIRFKSERHLNSAPAEGEHTFRVTAPESRTQKIDEPSKKRHVQVDDAAPLLLTDDGDDIQNPAMLILDEISAVDRQRLSTEDQIDYEPFPQANELIISEPISENEPPFSSPAAEQPAEENEPKIVDPSDENEPELSLDYNEPALASNKLLTDETGSEKIAPPLHGRAETDADELIITDPFAMDEPVFSIAGQAPPVILEESDEKENVETPWPTQDEDLAIVDEPPVKSPEAMDTDGSNNNPAILFDAEPTLTAESDVKPIAGHFNGAERKSPSEAREQEPLFRNKPAETWRDLAGPLAAEEVLETIQPVGGAEHIQLARPTPRNKTAFNLKTLLLIVLPLLAAIALWLSLSGKLSLGGGNAPEINTVPVTTPRRSPVQTRPQVQKPVQKIAPAESPVQPDESEKLVNEKISRAESFFKKGDVLNALAVVLEAKKIKMTEPLSQLEKLITNKIREDEAQAAEKKQAVQNLEQSEDQTYTEANAENTIEAWKKFLTKYPQGMFAARARNKIVVLEKTAAQKTEQEFQLKIRQAQKLKLRSDYMSLTQGEVNAVLQQLGRPAVQFDQLERGGERVIVDFNSGLMWTLWNKPMVFHKAKWWANRIYAGYSGWRLPTIEESLALPRMDPGLYLGLKDFAVWTGDGASDVVRSIWVLKLPQGQLVAQDYDQLYYVWAVRKAGR